MTYQKDDYIIDHTDDYVYDGDDNIRLLFFYTMTMRFATEKFNTTDKAQGILIGGSSACLGSAKLDWFLCFLLPRLFYYSSFTIPGGDICIETSS